MICRNLSTRHAEDERDTITPYTSLFWAGSCHFCTNVCFKAFSKSPSVQIGWIWPVLNGQVPVAKPQISIVFMNDLDSNLGRALGCLWLKDNSGNCKSLLLHLGHCVQEFLRLGAVTSSALCSTEQMNLSIYELVGLLQCDWFSCAFSHWSSFSPHPFGSCIFVCFWRDGTTDVTRTMHFGTPSAYEKVSWDHSVVCDLTLIIRDT